MKWLFRIVWIVLAVAVFLVGAVFFLPGDRLARIATQKLTEATGRAILIDGVALTVWPVLGVSVENLEIANADWSTQGPMLEADSAAIGVDAMSLLRGDIRVTHIEAHSPIIRLQQKKDGRASWQLVNADEETETKEKRGAKEDKKVAKETTDETKKPEKTNAAPKKVPNTITIERLTVTDAALIYEAEGSDPVSLQDVDLSLLWPSVDEPAVIAATVSPAGTPVSIDATIDNFPDFIDGEVSPLRTTLDTKHGRVALNGRANTEGSVAGSFTLSTTNTEAFLRSFGIAGVDLPNKLGRSLSLQAEVTLTPDLRLALRALSVDLGGNAFTGAADLVLKGTPQVNARLNVGTLDLTSDEKPARQKQEKDKNSGKKSKSKSQTKTASSDGWSTEPIDASGLSAFNGEIALSASAIEMDSFRLGKTRAILLNDNSRMVFELKEVAAYGGNVAGEFVVNNRTGLSVGGKMNVSSVQIQPLFQDAIELDRFTGQGDVEVAFLGVGQTVDAIVRSLSGTGSLAVGRGTIQGVNLDKLLRGDTTPGTTIFDDLTASWTIKSGVLTNKNLLMQLKNYKVSGKGKVGLGERNIDYIITPVALRANSGKGLEIPVLFKGPWSDISIRPDVDAALDAKLEDEKRALKREANKKLDNETRGLKRSAKKELSERLGKKPKKGQSAEDALKEEAKKRLRKLFD